MRKTHTIITTVICSLALAGGYATAQTTGGTAGSQQGTAPQTQGTQPQTQGAQNGTTQNGTMQNGTMQNGSNGSMSSPPANGNSGMQNNDANGSNGNQNSTMHKNRMRKSNSGNASGSNGYPASNSSSP